MYTLYFFKSGLDFLRQFTVISFKNEFSLFTCVDSNPKG